MSTHGESDREQLGKRITDDHNQMCAAFYDGLRTFDHLFGSAALAVGHGLIAMRDGLGAKAFGQVLNDMCHVVAAYKHLRDLDRLRGQYSEGAHPDWLLGAPGPLSAEDVRSLAFWDQYLAELEGLNRNGLGVFGYAEYACEYGLKALKNDLGARKFYTAMRMVCCFMAGLTYVRVMQDRRRNR